MKRTLLLILCSTATLGAATFASAQAAGPVGGAPSVEAPKVKRGPLVIEREIFAKLNLSADQQKQIRELVKKLGKDLKAMRQANKAKPDKDELHKKQLEIRKSYLDSLKTILTPDQLKQYRELHKDLRKKQAEERKKAPQP
ncbi:MAG TPA: hypothetical protein VG944_00280 [Fimbriimonas sp.]|nr:hypothetical protein [Fimbriimonas sp.]